MTEQEPRPYVMVVHPGGLGDLVLVSELIAGLKRTQPEQPLILVCRSEFAAIVDLYPVAADKVVGLPFQPYAWDRPSPELELILQSLIRHFAGAQSGNTRGRRAPPQLVARVPGGGD